MYPVPCLWHVAGVGQLMLLEVEKQKWNRKLEKAQKSLADARWKKKKATLEAASEREGAINLGHSVISDGPILQCDESVVSAAGDVSSTDYSRLAQTRVVDHSEQPPTLHVIPSSVQEAFFKHPETLDKYAQAHYKKSIQHSLQSWEAQSGSLLACSLRAAETALQAHERKLQEERSLAMEQNRRGGRRSQPSSSMVSSASLSHSSFVSTAGASRLTASQGFSKIGERSLSSLGTNTLPRMRRGEKGREVDDGLDAAASVASSSSPLSHPMRLMHSVQSVFENAAQVGMLPRNRRSSTTLQLYSSQQSSPQGSRQNLPSSPDGSLSIGESSLDAPISVLSTEVEESYLEKLADQGIFIDPRGRRAPRVKLDQTFIKDPARTSYGRREPVGKTRVVAGRDLEKGKTGSSGKEEEELLNNGLLRSMRRLGGGGLGGKFTSNGSFDLRSVPKLQSQVLTTKHPGMTAFSHAATMSITNN